ncbi:MAG: SGNH/GDSL hydrolase family protein [Tepidiformaceae bacterium]
MRKHEFVPSGHRAVQYAADQVAAANPDVVVLPLSAYTFGVGFVALRVRERWGERAWRWYLRIGGRVDAGLAGQSGLRLKAREAAQGIARKLIGTASHAPAAEVTAVYAEVIRQLARGEGAQVLVVAESRFGRRIQELNPGLVPAIEAFQSELRPLAQEHRLPWVDAELAVAAGGDRERAMAPDGVHHSAYGHRLYAAMVLDALVAALAPAAAAGREPLTARPLST